MLPTLASSAGEKLPLRIAGGRNGGAQQAGVEHLVEVLEAGEEEQLVAVAIELVPGISTGPPSVKPG